MFWLVLFLLGLNFAIIAFQDFKERRITALLFLPLLILSLFYPERGMYDVYLQLGINSMILILIYFLTWVYARIRGLPHGLIGTQIGWGDVFILIAIMPLLEPIALILLIETAALIGVLFYLIVRPENKEIPFAGIVSALGIAGLLTGVFGLNMFTDELYANFLLNV